MKTLSIVSAVIFLFVMVSCQSPVEYVPFEEYIYFNSFTSPQDTTGWWGYGGMQLSDEAAPGGGSKSLYVSGGCIYPHAVYDLGPFPKDLEITIEGWGKALQGTGGVAVGLNFLDGENQGSIGFRVDQPEWTFYKTDETLFIKSGETISLHIAAGGIAPAAILVDLLALREVK